MNPNGMVHDLLVEKGVLCLQSECCHYVECVKKILFNGAGDMASSAVKELALQA